MNDVAGFPFPPADRVRYGKPPLVQVICQLRFPTILKIESLPPAEFQERIRRDFPLLERAANPFGGGPAPNAEMLQVIAANFGINPGTAWNFFSEDRISSIALATDSLSLTTQSYSLWEDFVRRLRAPVEGLIELYQPSFFSRIGLRYQDVIMRSNLGLASVPWYELLKKEVLGEMAIPEIEANLQDARRMLRMRTPNGSGFITLLHGLGMRPGSEERGYMIDFDFSAEPKVEVKDAWASLDDLHSGVGRAFRWCIQDRLHSAMEPVPI